MQEMFGKLVQVRQVVETRSKTMPVFVVVIVYFEVARVLWVFYILYVERTSDHFQFFIPLSPQHLIVTILASGAIKCH